jgi:integrase-like protein
MEPGQRTDHPSAEWTLQQLREALPDDHSFSFLIHDRDSIFSLELDQAVAAMGVRVLRTPPRAPKANAVCERVVGTIRRECLDFLIPLGQRHLKHTLNRWMLHYNHGRVHMSLGPGIPAPLKPSRPTPSIDIGFRRATEYVAKPCWVDCTTNAGWKRSPPEHARSYCAPQLDPAANFGFKVLILR